MGKDRAVRARLAPLYFRAADAPAFATQVDRLRELLGDVAEILEPRPLGAAVGGADAALLPEVVGDAYRRVPELAAVPIPLLVLTSEFGTMAMWDWEVIGYLRAEGVETIAPYSLAAAKTACRALLAKRQLRGGTFLVYQDRPGESGFQPDIFKRFYWWEDECVERMREVFGLRVVKRSYAGLAARARAIPDGVARTEWKRIGDSVPLGDVGRRATLAALKLQLALREDLDRENAVLSAGINCLNESACSDTTPCLAWDLLYRERDLIWGCEADIVSMLTKFILHRSLRAPALMTNLYPFLMGEAALHHERIPAFPEVGGRLENHVLAAHCGYLGVLPRPLATEWTLRRKVLAIVDDNATAIDARLPLGSLTLAKLGPRFDTLVTAAGELVGYAGYPGSDCLNGAVIRVPDGHALMRRLPSHHAILMSGHDPAGVDLVGRIFGLRIDDVGTALVARADVEDRIATAGER
jgi:hypothetical protein